MCKMCTYVHLKEKRKIIRKKFAHFSRFSVICQKSHKPLEKKTEKANDIF